MHANSREEVQEVSAGDIAAMVGLKNTTTGNTLCDQANPIILESIDFPDPPVCCPRDFSSDRAEDEGGPGQAVGRAAEIGGRGSYVPSGCGRRDGSNDHLRNGRATSRHHRR